MGHRTRRRKENGNGWRRKIGALRGKRTERSSAQRERRQKRGYTGHDDQRTYQRREGRTENRWEKEKNIYIYIYRKRDGKKKRKPERDGEIFTRTKRKRRDEGARERSEARRKEGDGAKEEDGVKRTHREPRSHDLMNELAWLLATWWGGLHSFLLLGPFAEATSSSTISRPLFPREQRKPRGLDTAGERGGGVGVGVTADLRGRG